MKPRCWHITKRGMGSRGQAISGPDTDPNKNGEEVVEASALERAKAEIERWEKNFVPIEKVTDEMREWRARAEHAEKLIEELNQSVKEACNHGYATQFGEGYRRACQVIVEFLAKYERSK